MKKKSRKIYMVSGFIVGIVLAVAIALTLVLTGVISMPKDVLKISSSDATKSYDGKALTSNGYTILDGELKEGHYIEVITYGTQTEVGSSDNFFSVVIRDKDGKIVTNTYEIIKVCGTLTVH